MYVSNESSCYVQIFPVFDGYVEVEQEINEYLLSHENYRVSAMSQDEHAITSALKESIKGVRSDVTNSISSCSPYSFGIHDNLVKLIEIIKKDGTE